jgi:hypothetical protein
MAPTSLDSIGNTRSFSCARSCLQAAARILLKLESHNPTGSMKDRMARALFDGAIASGGLAPEGMVAVRGAFWTNQFENHVQAGGCRACGRGGVGAARA